ncbi:EAL domain-containing protein [Marinobacter sediminum]|uniref:sensor domain-containing phosphodiesterase n=1 Tax=Marinobacter sediminum TaxID=256323 RepID=UPI00202FE8D1|nr:EAL domain-containing protein [Marinobacter sediminum]MCM0614159.1 EAL domain-containing protein [Marinobacter sediminum]
MLELDDDLLINLALSFAEISSAGIDPAIDRFLRKVGLAVGGHRSYLFLIDRNTRTLSNTHEWCAPGVIPQRDAVQDLPLSVFPWLKEQLPIHKVVVIPDVSDLGEEAFAEKQEFERQDIRSLVLVALKMDGDVIGFFGVDSLSESFEASEAAVTAFKRCGDLLSAAVHRKVASEASDMLYQSLITFADQFPGVVFQFRMFADGSVTFPFISVGVEEMFGLDPSLLADDGAALLARIHENDQDGFYGEIEKSRSGLSPIHMGFQAVNHRSDVIWIEVKAVPKKLADDSTLWHGYFYDITEQKRIARRVQEQAGQTRAILDNIADGVITTDSEGLIQTFNSSAEFIFGYRASEVIGECIGMLMPEPVRDHQSGILMSLRGQEPLRVPREMEGLRKNGQSFPGEARISRVADETGEVFIGVVTDITERKSAEEEIARLAFYDSLTGLPNRRLLRDRLAQALAVSHREKTHGGLVFIDLDNFKTINDSAGHVVGDQLLKQVGARLQGIVRDWDTVARIGGDEFVLVLRGFASDPKKAASQLEKVCEKIRDELNQPYQLEETEYVGTPSIGVTLFFDHDMALEELLRQADMAMFRAKEDGKNRIRFFDSEMQELVTERLALESDLRKAIRDNEFLLHYQVQVDGAGTPVGAEALIRWDCPRRGMVAPASFIPLAEETGLIESIGLWVLEDACNQLASWSLEPVPLSELTISVNVSARQFHQAGFLISVMDILRRTGAPAEKLKIEVTESALAYDLVKVEQIIRTLRRLGVRVSLDDFGTGYSSLGYLKQLSLDELKIDQGFVRDILDDQNDAAIARMIIALADAMNLSVVAEGVETLQHFDYLVELGCQRFQGYCFGRPMASGDLAKAIVAPSCDR